MTWLGFRARLAAIGHILRGHRVQWRINDCCLGCDTCNLMIWCRLHDTDPYGDNPPEEIS